MKLSKQTIDINKVSAPIVVNVPKNGRLRNHIDQINKLANVLSNDLRKSRPLNPLVLSSIEDSIKEIKKEINL